MKFQHQSLHIQFNNVKYVQHIIITILHVSTSSRKKMYRLLESYEKHAITLILHQRRN